MHSVRGDIHTALRFWSFRFYSFFFLFCCCFLFFWGLLLKFTHKYSCKYKHHTTVPQWRRLTLLDKTCSWKNCSPCNWYMPQNLTLSYKCTEGGDHIGINLIISRNKRWSSEQQQKKTIPQMGLGTFQRLCTCWFTFMYNISNMIYQNVQLGQSRFAPHESDPHLLSEYYMHAHHTNTLSLSLPRITYCAHTKTHSPTARQTPQPPINPPCPITDHSCMAHHLLCTPQPRSRKCLQSRLSRAPLQEFVEDVDVPGSHVRVRVGLVHETLTHVFIQFASQVSRGGAQFSRPWPSPHAWHVQQVPQ